MDLRESDDRPYASAAGFFIGDRVELRPGDRRYKTRRGHVWGMWRSKHGNQPLVKCDDGSDWNALDVWLTRIKD